MVVSDGLAVGEVLGASLNALIVIARDLGAERLGRYAFIMVLAGILTPPPAENPDSCQ
jgi:O-antigen/teichoic acid export membrane protein